MSKKSALLKSIKVVSRLAPSPSGFLHIGNAWSFVLCWLIVRAHGGSLFLRMDDLDPDRSRAFYAESIIEDLKWLGLDWDRVSKEENGFVSQSKRTPIYELALEKLRQDNKIYPCFCSRKELRQLANAPHTHEIESAGYCPCREFSQEELAEKKLLKKNFSLRLKSDGRSISFNDLIYGEQSFKDYREDFALQRSDGVFAYQLASAVDDALLGVNLIIRGNDLLKSCPRQILVLENLGYSQPLYAHLPLILDHQGERLAKRHASLSLRSLREKGVGPELLLGYFAMWANLQERPKPIHLRELLNIFSLDAIFPHNIYLPEIEPFI